MVSSRAEAIFAHREWLLSQPYLLLEIREMKGKILGMLVQAPRLSWRHFCRNSRNKRGTILAIIRLSKKSSPEEPRISQSLPIGRIHFIDQ